MGFVFELDTTDFLYKKCDIRMNRYSFFTKKTYYTRVIRNGLTTHNSHLLYSTVTHNGNVESRYLITGLAHNRHFSMGSAGQPLTVWNKMIFRKYDFIKYVTYSLTASKPISASISSSISSSSTPSGTGCS